MHIFKYLLIIPLLVVLSANAQDSILTKRDAVDIALENNYDIKIAEGNLESAKNSASIYNSAYLPSLTASAGANYNIDDNLTDFQDGTSQEVRGAKTSALFGSLEVNYTVFNGLGRKYNYEKLKENFNLSELQSRQVIENSILNLFTVYYEVARLTQNVNSQVETMSISKKRLLRAQYGFDYGRNTKLDVLNAEVDFNNDSIKYLNLRQELENVKRDINVLLGRDVNTGFQVDTGLVFTEGLKLGILMDQAMNNNVAVLQEQAFLKTAEYDININRSNLIPRLGLSASYDYNKRFYDQTSIYKKQTTYGPTLSANLSWNIFDGGSTRVRMQNSKIALENQQISLDQTKQVLQRNVNNAWGVYQNSRFVLEAEQKNLETSQRNFDRTLEQQNLGQITSIEFRQAQQNLLNTHINFNNAKYTAKIAELALLKLSGELMNAEF
ncbi:MAG: TolC family protein [Bacteroidales bacterium]|nr:TolC family protein [Bacteroidales bacterium]